MVEIQLTHLPPQLIASLRRRTRRLRRQRALRRALQSVYGSFASQYAQWVDSFFDDLFLRVRATPLLLDGWESPRRLTSAQLAAAWRAQFSPTNTLADGLRAEATLVAATFLKLLEAELDAHASLRYSTKDSGDE